MLEYIVTSMTRLATAVGLNLPTYTINYPIKYPKIICQATGRHVVPLLPHMRPTPPLLPPPPHIVPRHIIVHPIQPEPEHIHYLVHVVLKEPPPAISLEELPVAKKVSNLATKPIKMAGVVIPVPVIEKLPAVIPVVEKLPAVIPVIQKLPTIIPTPVEKPTVRNLRPGHLAVECEGCEKHPLMSPQIYGMMIGTRRWGDMLYDGVI
jgi:hypothetical protein